MSRREDVIKAVLALIEAALPQAKVKRNEVKPDTIPADGFVNVRDGNPGDPDVTLSPLMFSYEHAIEVSVAASVQGLVKAETKLDAMLGAIGAAVVADRTLGGLCEFLYAEAPMMEPVDADGSRASRLAEFNVIAVYTVGDPLN